MRYTKEEIDEMDDFSALRRYYVAVELLQSMAGGGADGQGRPLGGGPSGGIRDTSAAAQRRSSSPAPSRTRRGDTYSFPSGNV